MDHIFFITFKSLQLFRKLWKISCLLNIASQSIESTETFKIHDSAGKFYLLKISRKRLLQKFLENEKKREQLLIFQFLELLKVSVFD